MYEWLRERPAHDGLTASEIADVSGIYDGFKTPSASAFQDLQALTSRELRGGLEPEVDAA